MGPGVPRAAQPGRRGGERMTVRALPASYCRRPWRACLPRAPLAFYSAVAHAILTYSPRVVTVRPPCPMPTDRNALALQEIPLCSLPHLQK